jgi:uncharacterized protein
MTTRLPVFRCARCGHEVFPARVLCPRCGSPDWDRRAVVEGVVEETTVLRRAPGERSLEPVPIGSVRVGKEVVVVARLPPGVEAGAPVQLEYRDGIPVAHARTP